LEEVAIRKQPLSQFVSYKTEKFTAMNRELPDLHKQAFMFKNTKRFQHDGGRAWIKDSQLHEARRNANGRLITVHKKKSEKLVEQAQDHKPSI
jgi:hypothetical protein